MINTIIDFVKDTGALPLVITISAFALLTIAGNIRSALYKPPKELQRGGNYRKAYFKANPGIGGKGIYICPYCGKLMWKKEKIQIDHIHAIHKVQRSGILSRRFQKLPNGVNNQKNLTHSCPTCNARKGSKGGLWVFFGKFGQYFMLPVRWGLIGTVIYFAVTFLIKTYS